MYKDIKLVGFKDQGYLQYVDRTISNREACCQCIDNRTPLQDAWGAFGQIMEEGFRKFLRKRLQTTANHRILRARKGPTLVYRELDLVIGTPHNPLHFVEFKTCFSFQQRHVEAISRQIRGQWEITHRRWPNAYYFAVIAAMRNGPKQLELREFDKVPYLLLPYKMIREIARGQGFEDVLLHLVKHGVLVPTCSPVTKEDLS